MKDKIFGVYKPKGMTSHDVVAIIRKSLGGIKVGHAGTLDPLATGVLVIATGLATKQLKTAVVAEKEYIATVKLGETSTTDDEEGEKQKYSVTKKPTKKDIIKALANFQGDILQIPPAYSAIRIKGQKAYKLSRQGQNLKMPPRQVELKKIELLNYRWPKLKLRLVTGSGFYVRSLARDLGEKLNSGGYLADLERTRVGQFLKKDAIKLEKFK